MRKRDRKAMFEVPDAIGAARRIEAGNQPARLQFAPVLIGEKRQQHLVMKMTLRRLPIDIEIAGIGRRAPPFQYIEPPGIVRLADAHMVRNEIDDVSEAMIA